MKRVVLTVVAALGLMILVLWPLARFNIGGPAASDPTTITSYVADFDVADNGDLAVTEKLSVDFPGYNQHGIFRFFDRTDPSAPRALRLPRDVSVTRDGRSEPVDLSSRSQSRYLVARIGDPDVTLDPGVHSYVIRYRVDGVLEPGTDGTATQFYWNLIPSGWAQSIEAAALTVHLPAAPRTVRCAIGTDATSGCAVGGLGTRTLHISTGALAPRTPVTILASLATPTPPAGDTLPWSTRLAPVLGDSIFGLVLVALLAAVAGAFGLLASRGSTERPPPYPLQYEPPPGIGPAEATYVVTEKIDNRAFVASLLWAAQQQVIDLRRDSDGWTITDKSGPDAWSKVDPATAAVAPLLGGPGGQFTARRGDVGTGQVLQTRIAAFNAETREWGRANGYLTKSRLGGAGAALVIGAAILAGISSWGTWFGMSVIGIVPGAFVLGAITLLLPSSSTQRTAAGRDLWSRLGGFRRVLSTPSSKQRFDFSGRQDLYTAYIPWAVAFGCADAWAKKYRTEMGTEPPVPAYFGGMYVGDHTGAYVDQMVGDFSSTVSSSISAYQATQSHSSGGGGSFSGGGGGGGGGGGSW